MRQFPAPVSNLLSSMIALLITSFLIACSQQQIDPISENDQTGVYVAAARQIIDSNATLKSVATFPIGIAVSSWITKKPKGNDLLKAHFDSKTVHAYMRTEYAPNKFNFQELDFWVKWAEANPIRLHGHCLVFHNGAPNWMLQFNGSTSAFEQVIKNHIQTIVGRHKGKIRSWDVFNEVFTSRGKVDQTPFRKMYRSDEEYMNFIGRCFEWAHGADPNALLFYNDYLFENSPAKTNTVIALVNRFKSKNVPIHGIGSQMHININTSESGIRDSFIKLASTGLQIHVSELDVMVNPANELNMAIDGKMLDRQSTQYNVVASLYKRLVPTRLQYGITLWDFSDADSWIVAQKKKNDAPCIFDSNYDKKPAFYGLLEGLMN